MSTETIKKHLWEIDHPYYGPDHCYYANGFQARDDASEFESWAEFAQPSSLSGFEGNLLYDFDDDLNFLYRWDWQRADPEDYEWEREENPGFEMPSDKLRLFYMCPRKGRMVYAEVSVTEADEEAVLAWLRLKAEYMVKMWEPLLAVTHEVGA